MSGGNLKVIPLTLNISHQSSLFQIRYFRIVFIYTCCTMGCVFVLLSCEDQDEVRTFGCLFFILAAIIKTHIFNIYLQPNRIHLMSFSRFCFGLSLFAEFFLWLKYDTVLWSACLCVSRSSANIQFPVFL